MLNRNTQATNDRSMTFHRWSLTHKGKFKGKKWLLEHRCCGFRGWACENGSWCKQVQSLQSLHLPINDYHTANLRNLHPVKELTWSERGGVRTPQRCSSLGGRPAFFSQCMLSLWPFNKLLLCLSLHFSLCVLLLCISCPHSFGRVEKNLDLKFSLPSTTGSLRPATPTTHV